MRLAENMGWLDKATALMGVATFLYVVFLLTIFPSSAALAPGYQTPIIAFEFAETMSDLAFLSGDSDAAVTLRTAMDKGNRYDMLFPFFYGGLLALVLLQFARQGMSIAWLGVVCGLLIIPADINENIVLLSITDALGVGVQPLDHLAVLKDATWAKWGLIAACAGLLAFLFGKQGHKIATAISGLAAVSITGIWVSGTMPIVAEIASLCSAVFFLFLTARSVRSVFRA